MELDLTVACNGDCYLSFIPIAFSSLDELFVGLDIKKIDRISIGLFNEPEPRYIEEDNYINYLGEINSFKDIWNYFSSLDEENYSIYKLGIEFERFTILYDDDSFLKIQGKIFSKEDYHFFHNLYVKTHDIYMKSGYLLDE